MKSAKRLAIFNGPGDSPVQAEDFAAMQTSMEDLQAIVEKQKGVVDEIVAAAKEAGGDPDKDAFKAAMDAHREAVAEQAKIMQTFTDQVAIQDQAKLLAASMGGRSKEQAEYSDKFDTWFRGRAGDNAPGSYDAVLEAGVNAGLSVDSDTDGGVTVPDELDTEIGRVSTEFSPIRQDARVITISVATYKKLVSLGGAVAEWVGERESRPETVGPKFETIKIDANELYANPFATQQLLDDSAVNIAEWLRDEVVISFTVAEGVAFATGDGTEKPRGYLTYTTFTGSGQTAYDQVEHIATGTAGDFDATNPTDVFDDTIAALENKYHANAKWRMSRTTWAEVKKIKDADGRSLVQPDLTLAGGTMLMGFPIRIDSAMPVIATDSLSIAFADWNMAYTIVDRKGITITRDPFSSKPNVEFYTTKRVGGGLVMPEALKLIKFGTT